MIDELQAELDRLSAELEALRATARTARAGRAAALNASLADLAAAEHAQRLKVAEFEARLHALSVRNAELRRALLERL